MKRIATVIFTLVLLITTFSIPVGAASYDAFTHIEQQDSTYASVLSRELYTPVHNITAKSLGIDVALDGITDICYDTDGKIYVLSGGTSQLFVLNPDYTLDTELKIINNDGDVYFTGAQGVFVASNNDIYIADTNNARVLVANKSGKIIKEYHMPESDLIPSDFVFQPTRVLKDSKGYIYILSSGCYYGALSYSSDDEFLGFYGANSVNATALETLAFLWDKLTGNDAKKAASVKSLPYSFVDFDLDPNGYLVTCTGVIEQSDNGQGQIRKIGPDGSNVLYLNSSRGGSSTSSSFNFLEKKVIIKDTKPRPQTINSIAVSDTGYIYALDKTYGLIYVYDNRCNMLGAVGGGLGQGTRLGLFGVPVSVAVYGETLLVADSQNASITVFNMTEYCKLLQKAQTLYLDGDYEVAAPIFEQVLALDSGNNLAYKGLAVASLNAKDYSKALDYAKKGMDYSTYDLAYQTMFKSYLERNFAYVVAIAVVLIGGIITAFVILKKRKKALITSPTLSAALNSTVHPFRAFENIKYKNQGSLIIAAIIVALYFLGSVLKETCSSFLFSSATPQSYSALYTLAKTVGLIVLWSVSNWLICVLFQGKGRLKEVFIVTSYSIIPLVIWTFVSFALTHFLPLSSSGILNGISVVIILYTFFLLSIAIMTIHDFSFFKFLGTAAATIFAMLLVVFVIFMIVIQIQRFWIFLSSIFMEFIYR